MHTPGELTELLRAEAGSLGFELVGVCPAVSWNGFARFQDWLAAGYAGEMQYLNDRRDAYQQPQSVLDGARGVLMLATPYRTVEPAEAAPGQVRISRYAWGDDY